MKEFSNKKILNIVTLCILLIIPFFKFFSMNLEMFGILNNYDNINPAIVLYISVPILLFIYIKDIIDSKRKLDIFDYIFYVLVFAGIISTIFSTKKDLAIFGKSFRHEGFLSVLCYYLLFINYKINGTKDDIKKFIKLILIIGILNSIYALFQRYTSFSFILRYYDDVDMVSGMCGNPNFLGSLIVTCLGIITSKFFMDKKVHINDILIIILLFISLINVQSTGPFLTFIIVFLFLIIFLHIKKKLIPKNILILFFILLTTYTSIYFINTFINQKRQVDKRCEYCLDAIKETINNGGNGRLKIWENSLEIVKDHLFVGVGYDNFYLVYPNPKSSSGFELSLTNILINRDSRTIQYILVVDNAHNVYLHTLVSTGIIGLVPYLLLCLLTFIKALKSKDKLSFILLGGFVAYSIQAFANISVVQVAPIYYIIIGLILSINE